MTTHILVTTPVSMTSSIPTTIEDWTHDLSWSAKEADSASSCSAHACVLSLMASTLLRSKSKPPKETESA